MKKILILGVVLLAGCASTENTAPAPAAEQPLEVRTEPPPIYALFGYREQLELTSEQISTLDSIARAAQIENDTVLARIRQRAEEREEEIDLTLLSQLTDVNLRTAERVGEVLTEEQRARVCELFEETRRERAEAAARPRRTDRRSSREDTPVLQHAIRTWPWCEVEA